MAARSVVNCQTELHLLLHTGLQIPAGRQCQETMDGSQDHSHFKQIKAVSQLPHWATVHPHWCHTASTVAYSAKAWSTVLH